jgi:hypothetical protein
LKKTALTFFILFSFFRLQAQRKIIHVFVALCDNKNQGIVPVPAKIGNGQDPANNLYWGCVYGVKAYFKNQGDWQMISSNLNPKKFVLERIVLKNKNADVFMIADAYDGAYIKECTVDFLESASGGNKEVISIKDLPNETSIGGNANLICYIGHDGLMDFNFERYPVKQNEIKREVILLACASKSFYKDAVKQSGAYPLLWTTNLMCPEAYTLKAAIDGWINNESYKSIQNRAAKEYAKYQHCSVSSANNLLVTGW